MRPRFDQIARPTGRLAPLAAGLAAAAALAAGCGDEEPPEPAGGEPATEAAAPPPQGSVAVTVEGDVGAKPTIDIPAGAPPESLQVEDLVEGDGAAAGPGDVLEVDYVGVLYMTGQEFDSSFDRGQPFQFQLGAGMVIPGWDRALQGMKVGGRRVLVIPPDLAYGASGSPPAIGPSETLVFVIDLLDVGAAPGG